MDNHIADSQLTETEGQASSSYPAREVPHEPMTVRGVALSGLFLLTLGYTLYFARAVLIPITVAFFFYFLLSPVIKGLKKLYIPEILGAAIVILALSGLIGYAAYQLAEPTTTWLAKLPQSFRQLERKLRPLRQSVQEVSNATKQVEKMTQITEEDPERASVKVEVQRQSLGQLMLNTTSSFAAGVVTMFILLYFLLATGRSLLLNLVKVLPRLHDKKAAVTIMHQIEHDTSVYLLTVTLINLGLGIATGLLSCWTCPIRCCGGWLPAY
jgi:predicted PurR-regulated permease PerM